MQPDVSSVGIVGIIVALIALSVGPGGVFFFLVRGMNKSMNGAAEATHRIEKNMKEGFVTISSAQDRDHDIIIVMGTTVDSLSSEVQMRREVAEKQEKALTIIATRMEMNQGDD